jgi:predicted GNAT superfamily acetyltransferase
MRSRLSEVEQIVTRAPSGLGEQAAHAAAAAARDAGVAIGELHDVPELREAARLFATVWETGTTEPVNSDMLRGLSHAGNYVAAARRDGRLVGVSVAYLSIDRGELGLHSHITGVLPGTQGRHTGFALKQHQRAWSLARGIEAVSWTYDPLVRRNAYFNIAKLGTEVTGFYPDFYGSMSDGINRGDETDRCLVTWRLADERVVRASEGERIDADADALHARGAQVVLADRDGTPRRGRDRGALRLCATPPDITALRAGDPSRARAWRRALRDAVTAAMADGLTATGFTRSGWYVFEPRP